VKLVYFSTEKEINLFKTILHCRALFEEGFKSGKKHCTVKEKHLMLTFSGKRKTNKS
jgi:hypothetical protein